MAASLPVSRIFPKAGNNNASRMAMIQHRCEACRQTLEPPTRVCGEEVECPRCHEAAIVPWPVLHRQPADEEVALWFWCKCPNCDAQAAVRKDEVGVWGACPSCLWPMQAPRFG